MSGKINVLEKQVVEMIAAGEVVERPASIAKELVENSIDAGATSITVEVQKGGIALLRVTDNGEGMSPEDVPLAFIRHATSKVRSSEDLNAIMTMGFRGEALPSISAMSRIEVITRTKDASFGTRYQSEGGEMLFCEETGAPLGTTVMVRDVFYNTPARMKFLKKESTEAANVGAFVEKAALSHPHIAFRFIKDGETKLRTPGDGSLQSAIRSVLGGEFAKNMAPVNFSREGVRVSGYVTLPSVVKGSRSLQNFFINGRLVQSKTCMAALQEAYHGKLMVGRFPGCVLHLHIPPQLVDVNVHPAKLQVRFADERAIFQAIYYAVKSALAQRDISGSMRLSPSGSEPLPTGAAEQDPLAWGRREMPVLCCNGAPSPLNSAGASLDKTTNRHSQSISAQQYRQLFAPTPAQTQPSAACETLTSPENWVAPPPEQLPGSSSFAKRQDAPAQHIQWQKTEPPSAPDHPNLSIPYDDDQQTLFPPRPSFAHARLVGELLDTYIILELGSDMLLVDKHAAHERILYNHLQREGIGGDRQVLLCPATIRLTAEEYGLALEHLALFSQGGLELEDFGDHCLVLREVAPILQHMDCAAIVEEFLRQLAKGNDRLHDTQLEQLYHTIACRSAIKGGDRSPTPALEELIRLLEQEEDAVCCPHGRPICVRITTREIEKSFGRLG